MFEEMAYRLLITCYMDYYSFTNPNPNSNSSD